MNQLSNILQAAILLALGLWMLLALMRWGVKRLDAATDGYGCTALIVLAALIVLFSLEGC